MRVHKAFVVLAVIVALLMPHLTRKGIAQSAAPAAVVIPPDLPGASEFVKVLQLAGLVVKDVQYSHLAALFKDTEQATFITTNLGVVEVAIFKGDMDAEHVTVTYSKDSDKRMMHHYVIGGMPTNGQAGTWFSKYPIYITLHHRWFIQTLNAHLDAVLKQALGQTTNP